MVIFNSYFDITRGYPQIMGKCLRKAGEILRLVASPFYPSKISHGVSRESLNALVNHNWLVVWNHGILNDFPWKVGNGNGIIIPTDFHSMIFQRGRLEPPTRQHRSFSQQIPEVDRCWGTTWTTLRIWEQRPEIGQKSLIFGVVWILG